MAELTFTKKQEKQEPTFHKACSNWVVVRRDYIAPSTKGGIILTQGGVQSLQKEVATGTVLCCGPGIPNVAGICLPQPCTGGDRVIWSRYGERVIEELEDGDLVAVPFQELIGVLSS